MEPFRLKLRARAPTYKVIINERPTIKIRYIGGPHDNATKHITSTFRGLATTLFVGDKLPALGVLPRRANMPFAIYNHKPSNDAVESILGLSEREEIYEYTGTTESLYADTREIQLRELGGLSHD